MTPKTLFPFMLLLALAPAPTQAQGPLPQQVWTTLPEARKAAKQSGRNLVMFVAEDEGRRKAALDFLLSLEGAKHRSMVELWLPGVGDSQAQVALDELGLRSMPALAWLTPNGKRPMKAILGEDCVPLSKAFDQLFETKPIPPAWVQNWAGKDLPLAPFLAFAEARKKDLGAAAQEPFRTWLYGMLAGPDPRLKTWAATRLVEANVPDTGQLVKPFPILAEALEERFRQEVCRGNRYHSPEGFGPKEAPFTGVLNPPLPSLGSTGRMNPKAPFWSVFRRHLETSPRVVFNVPFYVLMAPELAEGDRTWILRLLAQEGKAANHVDALRSALYWVATDWLILYGKPADWDAFHLPMVSATWDEPFARLRKNLDKVPGFWGTKPELQSMFCEGMTQDAFWEHPESCLATWGVTREALVEFGMDQMKTKAQPGRPTYPEEAKRMGFSTTLRLRMLVGPDGKTLWVRPEPGFALSYFAPSGMAFAMLWQFEPARVAGIPRPSQFLLTMPYALK